MERGVGGVWWFRASPRRLTRKRLGHSPLGRSGVQGCAVKLFLGISRVTKKKTASRAWGLVFFEPVKLRADYWVAKQRWKESKAVAALYDLTVRSRSKNQVSCC